MYIYIPTKIMYITFVTGSAKTDHIVPATEIAMCNE